MSVLSDRPGEPLDIDTIRREMARIRHDLHYDVRGAVEGARTLTDLKGYVAAYPWLAVGLATALGYLVVPRKQRPAEPVVVVPPPVERAQPREGDREPARNPGWLRKLAGLALPLAWRVGQNYAEGLVTNWLAAQATSQPMPQQRPTNDPGAGPGVSPGARMTPPGRS
jgi:hypothetical protein